MSQLTIEELEKHLRDALNHLHNPNRLRESPLAALFGVANRHDTPKALRRALIDGIASLRPADDEPPESRAWRFYEALYYRYVHGSSQLEIADQLGLSSRQLRRETRGALEALANHLWERYDLEARTQGEGAADAKAAPPAMGATVHEELAWLKDAPPESPADLTEELSAVLRLAHPLASQHGVRVDIATEEALPALAADPVALRQTLLSLLSATVLRAAPGGALRLTARSVSSQVEIRVECDGTTSTEPSLSTDHANSLETARELVSLCEGTLGVSDDGERFVATLRLPAVGRLPVLVIDDNAGALSLLQRYASATRYRIFGSRDPEQALRLAEEISPRVIVLDVMMPHIDGWMILGRLREHPHTGHIPVIVCTILAERELALSLGASDYLRKPVSRQDFLAALDRQVSRMESESRSPPGSTPANGAPTARRRA